MVHIFACCCVVRLSSSASLVIILSSFGHAIPCLLQAAADRRHHRCLSRPPTACRPHVSLSRPRPTRAPGRREYRSGRRQTSASRRASTARDQTYGEDEYVRLSHEHMCISFGLVCPPCRPSFSRLTGRARCCCRGPPPLLPPPSTCARPALGLLPSLEAPLFDISLQSCGHNNSVASRSPTHRCAL